MARPRAYSDEQRDEALRLFTDLGPAAASEQLGIPKGTIARWANEAGIVTHRNEKTQAATAASRADFEHRRTDLAHGLLDDIARLRSQLFAPCTRREVKTVGVGRGETEVEIVDVALTQPTFSEQTRIMTSIGIAVDKAQLLTGQATARIETSGGASIDDEVAALASELELSVGQA